MAREHRNLFLFQHSSAWLQFSEEEIGTFIGHSFLLQPAAARLQSQNTVKEHQKKKKKERSSMKGNYALKKSLYF